jgi:hypothetical protein
VKLTSSSPPAPDPICPPNIKVKEDNGSSVFNILNIYCCHWFLNRYHLIVNILSTQKDEHGMLCWVNFVPAFYTHLVWQAIALLPPLCPMAKGITCMFIFVLKISMGDGSGPPGSSSFFISQPKKTKEPKT